MAAMQRHGAADRPSVRSRSPDPGWRGQVLLVAMLTAPTGSLQPWGAGGTHSTLSQVEPRPPWPMAGGTSEVGELGAEGWLPPLREQA